VDTWFDLCLTSTIRCALGLELCASESADQRITLWLVALDLRVEQLCNDRLSSGIGVRATERAGHLGPPRLQRGPKRLRMVRMSGSVVPSHAFA
jgi:hypothetical protein